MGIRSLLRNAFGRTRTASHDEPSLPQQSAGPDNTAAAATPAAAAATPAAVSVPAQPTAESADRVAERVPDPGPLGPIPTPGPPHPEPLPQPEPEPTPMPKPKPIPEPEPVPTPDPNPVPEPAPGPDPEPAPAMSAAGATAPEAPVAEATAAEATVAEAPVAEAPVAEVPTAEPSAAAVSLEKVQDTAPALVSLYKSAGVTLKKHGLAGQRAAVYLVLDRSGSMRNYYKDGTVQHLAEQALGLAANLDDDGVVPVVFFSTDVDGTAEIDLAHHRGRIQELHESYGHMGRTNYHWAIEAVVDHYTKSGSTDPAFVIFQTDGAPYSKPAAEKALCEAAKLPIFWQFVGFGDPEGKGFDFLRKLDDLSVPQKRVVDNAGFFHAGREPRLLSDETLYQELMVEFPEWLAEARAAGIVQ
ncbi:VWA domain-containing protein [Streptomyces sp. NPDC026206]|uniref:vWA domain-containing protein n=1 Tax=Streptomyces sp. NPDC026206 TaxID=3157089 RepID=UPI0033C1B556